MVKILKTDEDTGVGDTVHRLLSEIGAERFKTLATQIGIPCGCDKRRDDWNQRFPYQA